MKEQLEKYRKCLANCQDACCTVTWYHFGTEQWHKPCCQDLIAEIERLEAENEKIRMAKIAAFDTLASMNVQLRKELEQLRAVAEAARKLCEVIHPNDTCGDVFLVVGQDCKYIKLQQALAAYEKDEVR